MTVGGGGEVAIGKEEEVLGLPHLLLAKEEMADAGRRLGIERVHVRLHGAAGTNCVRVSRGGQIGQNC